jgi:hypothetical protein
VRNIRREGVSRRVKLGERLCKKNIHRKGGREAEA